MAVNVDENRLALAWAIVRKIFQRDPDPTEGIGIDAAYLANVLDVAIAKWVAQNSPYRWTVVHSNDLIGVATVGNLVNLCYFHLVPASQLSGTII
jgi:hypothetical protein